MIGRAAGGALMALGVALGTLPAFAWYAATARASAAAWGPRRYCSVRSSEPTPGMPPHHGSGPR